MALPISWKFVRRRDRDDGNRGGVRQPAGRIADLGAGVDRLPAQALAGKPAVPVVTAGVAPQAPASE
ncbi:hypothetical protein [Actinoplanes utahensis]|uniref:hypothetical protein n=1 Tax=Actinoplanes utahensis TaxID=1869 RepID=UPI0006915E24|nr:hypothetical protein [Actinoplanes utahensis]